MGVPSFTLIIIAQNCGLAVFFLVCGEVKGARNCVLSALLETSMRDPKSIRGNLDPVLSQALPPSLHQRFTLVT